LKPTSRKGCEVDCYHFALPAQIHKQIGVAAVRLITKQPGEG
jgi:hypothetical protein